MKHIQYMSRCLQLAQLGAGYVHPNPMVGAVLVHNDKIIGEGYHMQFGGPHAEPNAINSVKDKALLRDSTLYISLEPCSHYGKTPPCADLIVSCGIPRVVIGMLDPNPKVAGRGVRKLQEAGIEVQTGCLEQACRELNKHFLMFHEQKRPYISLKWAQTRDGFIDRQRENADTPPLALSNELTRIITHRQRAEHQAILIGGNTAVLDNPRLNVRNWHGNNPIRIAIDRSGKIPESSHLCDGSVPTIIYSEKPRTSRKNLEFITLDFQDEQVLEHILQSIYEHNINSVLVEGGAFILNEFIRHGLWDEARIEIAPIQIGKGVVAPVMPTLPFTTKTYQDHTFLYYRSKE